MIHGERNSEHRGVLADRSRAAAHAGARPACGRGRRTPRAVTSGAVYGVSPCWSWLSMFVSSCCRPCLQVRDVPRLPLGVEVVGELRVAGARRQERRVERRVGVVPDLHERRELRPQVELGRAARAGRRRHVPERVCQRDQVVRVVARYLTRSHASCGCLVPCGMPTIVPPTRPDPYRLGWPSATGTAPWRRSSDGCSRRMNAVRHSPSNTIATLPVSNALVGLNSEFVYVAKNFWRFE